MTNWQDAARDAALKPPQWALDLLGRMKVYPINGQFHMVNSTQYRYAVDGSVFVLRKLLSTEPGFFGPWATLEWMCPECGKEYSSLAIHDQAELGAVLDQWPPRCKCRNVSRETMEGS